MQLKNCDIFDWHLKVDFRFKKLNQVLDIKTHTK